MQRSRWFGTTLLLPILFFGCAYTVKGTPDASDAAPPAPSPSPTAEPGTPATPSAPGAVPTPEPEEDGGASAPSSTSNGSDASTTATLRKRVFITSAVYAGDLRDEGNAATGLEGADKLCTASASTAGAGGIWKAWLSGKSGALTVNAIDRIADVAPWYGMDGVTQLFSSKAQLTGDPFAMIAQDETGRPQPNYRTMWTATSVGAYGGPACEGATGDSWTSIEDSVEGTLGATDFPQNWSTWVSATGTPQRNPCFTPQSLICIEQ